MAGATFRRRENQGRRPRPFGQSPSVAWMSASAATAAVSARRMRGPRLRRTTRGAARIAARSSSSKPPSGPISRPTPPSRVRPRERVERIRLFRLLVAEDEQPLRRPAREAPRRAARGGDFGRPDHAALLAGLDRVRAQALEIDARDLGAPGDDRHEPPRAHLDRLLRHVVEPRVLERREQIVDVRRRLLRPRPRAARAATRSCAKSPRGSPRIRRRGR